MLDSTILKIAGISEDREGLCKLVNNLIKITQADNIDFEYLDSVVCSIQNITKLSKLDVFKKFVQYPYYEVYYRYIEIVNKLAEQGECYFIGEFEKGVYEYDSYISDLYSIECYIEQALEFDRRVSVERLVSILSRLNIVRKEFSLIDLVNKLVSESNYEHIDVLNYLEDVYDDISMNDGSIEDYYIVKKEFGYGIEVKGDR